MKDPADTEPKPKDYFHFCSTNKIKVYLGVDHSDKMNRLLLKADKQKKLINSLESISLSELCHLD